MTSRLKALTAPAVLGPLALLVAGWFGLGLLDAGTLSVIVLALYYAVGAASFNFLWGSLGAFSLAQPVFLAVGGYTGVYLYNTYGISPWLAMPIAAVAAAVLAWPIAWAVVRAGGGAIMTALITLIVGQAVPSILIGIKPLGGAVGLYLKLSSQRSDWGALQFTSGLIFGRILLVINVLTIIFVLWWRRSRFGMFTVAVRDSPEAASAMGVPTNRIRTAVFVIAAMMAAPAGVVFAQYNLLTSAGLFLGGAALFQVIVIALVGGADRPWGALVGAVVIVYLSNAITDATNDLPGVGPLTFACVFVLMAMVLPRGISGSWAAIIARRRREVTGRLAAVRRAPTGVDGDAGPPVSDVEAPVGVEGE